MVGYGWEWYRLNRKKIPELFCGSVLAFVVCRVMFQSCIIYYLGLWWNFVKKGVSSRLPCLRGIPSRRSDLAALCPVFTRQDAKTSLDRFPGSRADNVLSRKLVWSCGSHIGRRTDSA